MVAELRQLPPATDLFLTHGLRKHGATELAERGANALQIVSFLAHERSREALTCNRAANRKTLAEAGMALVHAENLSNLSEWLDKIPPQTIEKKGKEWNLATPAERGELRSFKNLPRKVPNAAVIRNQWLTRNGSNFSGNTPAKKKVAGRVAALSDDKQKFNARPDYQNRRNPASSGSEVQP